MSRLFDDGSSEYIEIEQAVLSGTPLAMVSFFTPDNVTSIFHTLICLADKDVDGEEMYLGIENDKLRAVSSEGGSGREAISTATLSADTLYHGAGLFVSDTDRRCLVDGGNKGTDANDRVPANLDRTSIGRIGRSTPAHYMGGMIAEAAIWDLSGWPGANDTERADAFEKILPSLAAGYTPDNFPLGLVAYWPLIRGLNDKFGGYNLTANGTIVAAHPRIILPINSQIAYQVVELEGMAGAMTTNTGYWGW